MKSITLLLAVVALTSLAQPALSAESLKDENGASLMVADDKAEKKSTVSISAPSLTAYGTVAWPGGGKPAYGVGADLNFNLTKNLGLAFFGESDNPAHSVVDRAGVGLRYTAFAGSKLSLDGGIQGAYDIEGNHTFVRLPLGANFILLKSESAELSIRAAWAFDISGDGKQGTAAGRAFIGPTFKFNF